MFLSLTLKFWVCCIQGFLKFFSLLKEPTLCEWTICTADFEDRNFLAEWAGNSPFCEFDCGCMFRFKYPAHWTNNFAFPWKDSICSWFVYTTQNVLLANITPFPMQKLSSSKLPKQFFFKTGIWTLYDNIKIHHCILTSMKPNTCSVFHSVLLFLCIS